MDDHIRRLWRSALLCMLATAPAGCAAGESRPPVTVEQVVQMSKAGVPAAEIVQKMRDAGTVYRVSGSRLAALKVEGVPDEVLDYMQSTWLAQERARGAMDYGWSNPWYWGPYPYNYWGPRGYWGPYWSPYWGYPYPYRPRHVAPKPPRPPPPSGVPAPHGTLPSPAAPRPGLPVR